MLPVLPCEALVLPFHALLKYGQDLGVKNFDIEQALCHMIDVQVLQKNRNEILKSIWTFTC